MRPVLLSGGSGTRLWPLSTPEVPKQFIPLFGGRSLFGLTLDRLTGLAELRPTMVVTGEAHEHLVAEQVDRAPIEMGPVLVEPLARNTAPAALAAALTAGPDEVLVILPSDHLVTDVDAFHGALATAAALAEAGGIVTFGIEPTRPATGFGYIEVGRERGPAREVARFKEKPAETVATAMVADGHHLWNSGMFVVRASHLVAEAAELCPEVLEGVRASLPAAEGATIRLGPEFAAVESISLDHAIMEKTRHALVVPVDLGWSDVGSFRSLLEVSERDEMGNHIAGDVMIADVTGSYLRSTSRRVVVAGLDSVVVVETPDTVLVLPLDRAQGVKELYSRADRE